MRRVMIPDFQPPPLPSRRVQLAALRAGFGIGGCQENIARRTPELAAVLPNAIQYALEVWLVMHENLKTTRRVRLLFDHLAAGLTDYVKGRW